MNWFWVMPTSWKKKSVKAFPLETRQPLITFVDRYCHTCFHGPAARQRIQASTEAAQGYQLWTRGMGQYIVYHDSGRYGLATSSSLLFGRPLEGRSDVAAGYIAIRSVNIHETGLLVGEGVVRHREDVVFDSLCGSKGRKRFQLLHPVISNILPEWGGKVYIYHIQ